jgi:hypothetical protein
VFERAPVDELLNGGAASLAVPGVVAIVVNRDGVLYEGAAGRRSVESPLLLRRTRCSATRR